LLAFLESLFSTCSDTCDGSHTFGYTTYDFAYASTYRTYG
jgi:hypothetical protein